MTIETLQSRLDNIRKRLAQKQQLIVNKTKTIENKKKALNKLGIFEYTTEANRANNQAFWIAYSIQDAQESIENAKKQIPELEAQAKEYADMIAQSYIERIAYETEYPESIKELAKELEQQWNEFDKQERDKLKALYRTLGYIAFTKRYKYADLVKMDRTDEQIEKDNKRSSEQFAKELYNRVEKITGELTNWEGVYLAIGAHGLPTLNGVVYGKTGKCRVESIIASGPIQRPHVRVLTKEMI